MTGKDKASDQGQNSTMAKKKGGCARMFFVTVGGIVAAFIALIVVAFVIDKIRLSTMVPTERAKLLAERKAQAARDRAQANASQEEKEAARKAERARIDEMKAAAERKKLESGLHCLSRYDGSNIDFQYAVKDQLRDPDSFQVIETRIGHRDENDQYPVIMTFRSKNAFGGYAISRAEGYLTAKDCKVVYAIVSNSY
jgi:hypothetical protein